MITMQSKGFSSRRFASTTVASEELIRMLVEDGLTWSEAASAILEGYDDTLMPEFVS